LPTPICQPASGLLLCAYPPARSGGFVHLYTALDNGLFDKYGIKLENIFIRGSAQNLTAPDDDEVQVLLLASDAIIRNGSGDRAKNRCITTGEAAVCLGDSEKRSGGRRTQGAKPWVLRVRET